MKKYKITSHICKGLNLGIHGNLFGGNLMAWIDEAGAILAVEELNSKNVVTKFINSIEFNYPVKETDIVEIYGGITKIGNTSITIKLSVMRVRVTENSIPEKLIICEPELVFVLIDESGHKKEIPQEIKDRIHQNYLLE